MTIVIKRVSKVFPIRKGRNSAGDDYEFVALADIDLTISSGEFLTIVGPSGCGKTTLLDILGGLTAPTSGEIEIDGRPITAPGLDRSIVFQQYALLPWRSAAGNIEFALEAAGGLSRAERRERADRYLDLVGLRGFSEHYPHELSGGMKQRVAIARSLSYHPSVLLMDEPFGALDAQTRETLQEELLGIWRQTGTTIVFITHAIDEAVYLGQRVAIMSPAPGRIRHIVKVDLDHDILDDVRSSEKFSTYRHEVWTALRNSGPLASRRLDEKTLEAAR